MVREHYAVMRRIESAKLVAIPQKDWDKHYTRLNAHGYYIVGALSSLNKEDFCHVRLNGSTIDFSYINRLGVPIIPIGSLGTRNVDLERNIVHHLAQAVWDERLDTRHVQAMLPSLAEEISSCEISEVDLYLVRFRVTESPDGTGLLTSFYAIKSHEGPIVLTKGQLLSSVETKKGEGEIPVPKNLFDYWDTQWSPKQVYAKGKIELISAGKVTTTKDAFLPQTGKTRTIPGMRLEDDVTRLLS